MKIVLHGYYGHGNFGDDIMLLGLLQVINRFAEKKQRIKVYIWSYSQEVVRTDDFPFLKIYVLSGSGVWAKFTRLISLLTSNLVVWGGGTALYEENEQAQGNNLAGLKGLLRFTSLVRLLRKNFVFLSVGVGHVVTKKGQSLVKRIVDLSSSIVLRDKESLLNLNTITGRSLDYPICGDLAMLLNSFPSLKPEVKGDGLHISFSGMYYLEEAHAKQIASCLNELIRNLNAIIHFLPAQYNTLQNDNDFHRLVAQFIDVKQACVIHEVENSNNYKDILSSMDFHIGMRLHSCVMADILNIPCLAISYSPKVTYYINKTEVLTNLRLKQLGEVFSSEDIQKITRNTDYTLLQQFLSCEKNLVETNVNDLLDLHM